MPDCTSADLAPHLNTTVAHPLFVLALLFNLPRYLFRRSVQYGVLIWLILNFLYFDDLISHFRCPFGDHERRLQLCPCLVLVHTLHISDDIRTLHLQLTFLPHFEFLTSI